ITFRTGFQFEYDDPREDTSPNYHLYQFQTGLTLPSSFGCVPDIGLKYTSVKYAQFDPFDVSKKREDIRWDITIRISRRITDSIQIMFLWTHTLNDSNLKVAGDVDPYEFTRNVCTFLISGTF
ncbi:MAG: hypothetical protein JRI95_11010, partial [Deltaproteobacteria bacterium]|nr:hypothetical protein [Deltaproteobacteria bacterium]